MTDRLTVLVLGVGGNVSQGILKALALSTLPCRVVGACVSPLSLGLYTVDRSYISPQANDAAFLDWLTVVCRQEGVQAILSGVEPVLAVLAQNVEAIERETGARCVVSNPSCLAVGDDKLVTSQWLEANGCDFRLSAASEDNAAVSQLIECCGYPLSRNRVWARGGTVLSISTRRRTSLMLHLNRGTLCRNIWVMQTPNIPQAASPTGRAAFAARSSCVAICRKGRRIGRKSVNIQKYEQRQQNCRRIAPDGPIEYPDAHCTRASRLLRG